MLKSFLVAVLLLATSSAIEVASAQFLPGNCPGRWVSGAAGTPACVPTELWPTVGRRFAAAGLNQNRVIFPRVALIAEVAAIADQASNAPPAASASRRMWPIAAAESSVHPAAGAASRAAAWPRTQLIVAALLAMPAVLVRRIADV